MRKVLFSLLTGFIALSVVSCSQQKEQEGDPAIYAEANEIHQSSLDIREELMEMEKTLKESGIKHDEIKELLKAWDKDIIEVPGYEHSHDDEHQRKYHVHNPMKPFNDEEHLEYQKIMHQEIVDIREKINEILAEKVNEEEDPSVLEEATDPA
jgi:DNA-binding transcriptional MerR regulator